MHSLTTTSLSYVRYSFATTRLSFNALYTRARPGRRRQLPPKNSAAVSITGWPARDVRFPGVLQRPVSSPADAPLPACLGPARPPSPCDPPGLFLARPRLGTGAWGRRGRPPRPSPARSACSAPSPCGWARAVRLVGDAPSPARLGHTITMYTRYAVCATATDLSPRSRTQRGTETHDNNTCFVVHDCVLQLTLEYRT